MGCPCSRATTASIVSALRGDGAVEELSWGKAGVLLHNEYPVCSSRNGTVRRKGSWICRSGSGRVWPLPCSWQRNIQLKGVCTLLFLVAAGVTQNLQKLIHSAASLDVPCKCQRGRGGDRTDIGMSVPGSMQGCSERLCQTKGLLRRMFVAAGLGVAGAEALPAQPNASGRDSVVGLTDPSQVPSSTDQRGSRNFHFVLL